MFQFKYLYISARRTTIKQLHDLLLPDANARTGLQSSHVTCLELSKCLWNTLKEEVGHNSMLHLNCILKCHLKSIFTQELKWHKCQNVDM